MRWTHTLCFFNSYLGSFYHDRFPLQPPRSPFYRGSCLEIDMFLRLPCILAVVGRIVLSQSTSAQTFWPAMVPLAVRSPYLNAWMDVRNGSTPQNAWPVFWDDSSVSILFLLSHCVHSETKGIFFQDRRLGWLYSDRWHGLSVAGSVWDFRQLDEYSDNTDTYHLHSTGCWDRSGRSNPSLVQALVRA
jgi:hypothetical protein